MAPETEQNTLPIRNQVKVNDTWDLGPIYASMEDWEAEFQGLAARVPIVSGYKGRLGESPAVLLEATELLLGLNRILEKLWTYSHLLSDVDLANAENLSYRERVSALSVKLGSLSSFFRPELLSLPEARIDELLADPALQPYKRMLSEVVRYKPHTLSTDIEEVLALGDEVYDSCAKVFSQLNNADLIFGTVEVDARPQPLSHGTFTLFLKHHDRGVRQRAFETYYREFDEHRNTIASTLAGSIKKDVYLSRVRKFPSAREAALFHDNMPLSVYDNLISAVSAGLEPLYRYYRLRGEKLGLEDQTIYDTYVPLVSQIETSIPYTEASELVLEALKPLGEEYVSVLRRGLLEQRWVDRYENKGKRSGAYSSGCYDTYPYILMNYKERSLNDVFTLAHEAGHSMHSHYSKTHQPYQDHQYTIFVAEVASTFNEQLLAHYLKQRYAGDRRMIAYLVNQEIDDIKATLFRQTMFAEFEKITHEIAERDEPLTVDVFRGVYRPLLEKYFGPAVSIPELTSLECLRIPHFYNAFYVYKYATGISAAITLAERVLAGDTDARDRYLNFLRSGGSKFPLDLLKDSGVDMREPAPVRTALGLFSRLVDQLTEALKHNG